MGSRGEGWCLLCKHVQVWGPGGGGVLTYLGMVEKFRCDDPSF